ncbi:hypothetical protein M407DRAFT_246730 [Tulasnella calospora MUT 4182]|uniref:Uncharacterized protein n=1 Tax=Tulasnella calospora MUT 4182 TaxID=1051891 RepID=A0A0C3Q3A8_9AGAM|nr:hypothetical protein M407DRAFT_246730 [Tulasnella calospora MUT 4182]
MVLSIKIRAPLAPANHHHRQEPVAVVSQYRAHHSRNYPPLTSSPQLPGDILAPSLPAPSDP